MTAKSFTHMRAPISVDEWARRDGRTPEVFAERILWEANGDEVLAAARYNLHLPSVRKWKARLESEKEVQRGA